MESSKAEEVYADSPLTGEGESIRLINIQPELSKDGLIQCELHVTSFAERKAYYALSYRWGETCTKRKILLNSIEFEVTDNLWYALDYMRRMSFGQVWIDAISINQGSISEKSSQIRIMSHIYTRALIVLVWLGVKYTQIEMDFTQDSPESLREMVVADEYWNRVWILQELGKGRKIQVAIGTEQGLDWAKMVTWLGGPSTEAGSSGPFKIDNMRRNRYAGAYTLRSLIENHADALCSNRRDKIYALVGLSGDGRGFPIDYSRSLFDVWVDTVRFMNRRSLLPEDLRHLVEFCHHLKHLLDLHSPVDSAGIINFQASESSRSLFDTWRGKPDEMSQSSVLLRYDVLGVITSIGPTASEIASSVKLTEEWEANLQRVHQDPPEQLAAANEQHDNLLELILNSEDANIAPQTQFEHYQIDITVPYFIHIPSPGRWESSYFEERQGGWEHPSPANDQPRLAILQLGDVEKGTLFTIALVPSTSRLGDLVCRVRDFPMKRIVLRHELHESDDALKNVHVCGSAVLAKELVAKRYSLVNTRVSDMKVRVDATTFYALLFSKEYPEIRTNRAPFSSSAYAE